MQIVRFPYDQPAEQGSSRDPGEDEDREDALVRALGEVESILWHGVPGYHSGSGVAPRATCGGVLHYLGRDPVPEDKLSLYVIRDLQYRQYAKPDTSTGGPREMTDTCEFLAEFSLQVKPGAAVAAMA
jgi:hypothetical protein